MKNHSLNTLILFFIFFITPYVASSAVLHFDGDKEEVKEGEVIEVSLYILPKKERINAISGIIKIQNNLEFDLFSADGSIISAWVKKPEKNNLTFSGIVAGGFEGVNMPYNNILTPGKIFTLRLKAVNSGRSTIDLGEDVQILLADGEGTELPSLDIIPFEINILANSRYFDLLKNVILLVLAGGLLLWYKRRYSH